MCILFQFAEHNNPLFKFSYLQPSIMFSLRQVHVRQLSQSSRFYSNENCELQFELGPRCCTVVVAPEPVFGGSLSSVTVSLDAPFPFLPAGLVYSVVLGLDLRAGLVQVRQLLLLGDSFRL